jgi:ADP-ribose pyrophosphatase YjhB (NUDIX family)
MDSRMEETGVCYLCHKDLAEDAAFCGSCGKLVCTACSAELSQEAYDSAYPVGVCPESHGPERKKQSKTVFCPQCGAPIKEYRSPLPTVDIIIQHNAQRNQEGLVLIMRKRQPRMWALPGGFCEYGESLEEAAVREAKEETGLDIELVELFYTYSDPHRDPRHHTITTVFLAKSAGEPLAGDDAREVRVFGRNEIPEILAFDHRKILEDYFLYERTGVRPRPRTRGPENRDS